MQQLCGCSCSTGKEESFVMFLWNWIECEVLNPVDNKTLHDSNFKPEAGALAGTVKQSRTGP